MIPCAFGDLGKKAKDLLEKNFPLDHVKFDFKSSTKHDIDFTISGTHLLANQHGGLTGFIESKYKIPKYGATLTDKWSSASALTCDLTVENKFVEGLKNSIECTLEPQTQKFGAALSTAYKRPYLNAKIDASRLTAKPVLTSSLVCGVPQAKGFLAGAQASFDTASASVSSWQCALTYDVGDYALMGSVRGLSEYTASYYQLVNPKVESALSVTYTHPNHLSTFAVTGKYNFDSTSWVKAKVESSAFLTLSYGFTLLDDVKLILGGQIDGKNINGGKHRLGLSVEFQS
jgi:voltage-dependent anion channel protein 2